MANEEEAKGGEGQAKQLIQIQTGDLDVAKLQLAARWVEMAGGSGNLDEWLKAFNRAYKSIDDTLRM